MTPFAIRPATVADLPFLWDMQFESGFFTDEEWAAWRRDPQPPPELVRYLDAWGRPGDAGVVAQDAGNVVSVPPGIAPELAIAVEPEHRGRRIGGDLLVTLARKSRLHPRRHRRSQRAAPPGSWISFCDRWSSTRVHGVQAEPAPYPSWMAVA
jgi:GNAT superfamily N-acetyltransferase